jgi:CsoR family transcriptional regulator, copper-sensing transcriptional repressor
MRHTLLLGLPAVKYRTGVCYGRNMATHQESQSPGYTPHKEQLLKRLARIEGQVRGIAKMIEDDRYCIDVLTQLGAVDTALEAVAVKVLEEHVQHCVAGALASGDPVQANEKTAELLEAVKRFAKTR